MEAVAKIKKMDTGEIRDHNFEEDDELCFWSWREGNFSCDCNRAILFDDSDIPCSDGKYLVNIYGPDGKCMYREY
jgi:hypothetical protein